MTDLPAIEPAYFDDALASKLTGNNETMPRILILYGSVRERSYSRFAAEEAGRLLAKMGAEVKIFNPSGLPLPDDAPESHPKVLELRELVRWCDGMVWSSPERHGAMSSVMKAQIDWIPLSEGAVRPSQGKTLAVMQVCGVLGIFRPKTTKCSGGPAVCGLQRGITFFEIPIWALFE